MKTNVSILAGIVFVFAPSIAFANAGTPLVWAGMLHLVFGNAIIGVVEGLLLSLVFRLPKWRTIGVLIAANYASAWLGGFLPKVSFMRTIDITLDNLPQWFWVFVIIAFVTTLVVEFPFILFALRKTQHFIRKSIIATLLLHCVSYVLLFGFYWSASGTRILTDLDVVSVEQMSLPEGYNLYYISADGHSILRSDLTGNGAEKIEDVESGHRDDRLFVRPRDNEGYDLFILLEHERSEPAKEELVSADFSPLAPVEWRIADGHTEDPRDTWLNFGPVPKLVTDSDWDYRTGFWPVEGISGKNSRDGSKFHFSLETPFVSWFVRNAAHIEGDFVVLQLGGDQICILQPQRKQIALIARGSGPVVAKTKTPAEATQLELQTTQPK